jgi:hypothetical protein
MAPPQTVYVDVHIFDGLNGLDFDLHSGIASGPKGRTLTFKNNGHPGFLVVFHIVDDTGRGFRFKRDPEDALWVRPIIVPGDECPQGPCSWGQFEPQSVTGSRMMLIVRNRNEYTQKFGFTLRVIDADDNEEDLDPIGNNQNGPQA